MLRAQAGVHAVASQLLLRGISVSFPAVDTGYDLLIESGLRIQVKSANLRINSTGNYFDGAYGFHLRRGDWDSKTKSYSRKSYRAYNVVADYFVLWGIDENRFFILPTSAKPRTVWFSRRGTISRSKNSVIFGKKTEQRLADMEDRWDLLDLNSTSNALIDSATISEPVTP